MGTIEHPFKQLAYAFVEILNYHSHSDRNVTIYLMEYTMNELPLNIGHVVNMTNVDILPYTLKSSDPDKATIVGMDKREITSSPSTSLSILKSYELRIDEMITNRSEISDNEKSTMGIDPYNIVIIRSNFRIQNMELISEYAKVTDNPTFFLPLYIQEKVITYKDLHIRLSGTISTIYDPCNFVLENIDVDYYKNIAGFETNLI